MRHVLFASVLALAVPFFASAVTMDLVTVGDPGNAADPLNTNSVPGIGSVGYTYAIGKYEVRNSEYVEFLNAVAATDTFGLYNTNMGSAGLGGISRSGSEGSYTYSVKSGYENTPVVCVSFYDSVRFVNWLENGQPTSTNQVAGTTETGSYSLITDGGTTTDASARSVAATWVIPYESEWYKAAYYQPSSKGGPSDSYWLYPMQTDSAPYSDQPPGSSSPDASRAGNFYNDDGLANGYNDGYAKTGSTGWAWETNYATDVGAYTLAGSYYGTFDQGGNVHEWNETRAGLKRGMRPGGWGGTEYSLWSRDRHVLDPSVEDVRYGFRVAAIPKSPVVAPSLGVAKSAFADLGLVLVGGIGSAYQIEASDNLTNWQPWASVTLPSHVWITNFTVQSDLPRLFWRARLAQ